MPLVAVASDLHQLGVQKDGRGAPAGDLHPGQLTLEDILGDLGRGDEVVAVQPEPDELGAVGELDGISCGFHLGFLPLNRF